MKKLGLSSIDANKDPVGIDASETTVTTEPMSHYDRYWQEVGGALNRDCLFMLPPWLGAWWSRFGKASQVKLYVVRRKGLILGIAPLIVNGGNASLVSDSDLIDYSDFVISPSREQEFFRALFDCLRSEGAGRLDMPRVRSDSAALSCLRTHSSFGYDISCNPVDVFYEMDLPDTWEGYLDLLPAKERHETRRKLRRMESAGNTKLRVITDKKDVPSAMDTFVALFKSNRLEKMQFMTADVESFFRSLAVGMADAGFLKLFFLDLENKPVATAMCFDYHSTVYLYNNGYDLSLGNLSVGLLSKILSIRQSIELGKEKYNFLRGSETYKGRLGGQPVSLLHCEVTLK